MRSMIIVALTACLAAHVVLARSYRDRLVQQTRELGALEGHVHALEAQLPCPEQFAITCDDPVVSLYRDGVRKGFRYSIGDVDMGVVHCWTDRGLEVVP